MLLLGFAGKARHGKDTCSKIATEIAWKEYGVLMGRWAFAHPPKAQIYGRHDEYLLDDVLYHKPPHIRKHIQEYATERGRMVYGGDMWIREAQAYLQFIQEGMPFLGGVVFSDVRFQNEIEFIRLGGQIPREVQNRLMREVAGQRGFVGTDDEFYSEVGRRYEEERDRGIVLYIRSNRPTLEGGAAQHSSETVLDMSDAELLEKGITGVITNNLDTTMDELADQIRPYIKRLWDRIYE